MNSFLSICKVSIPLKNTVRYRKTGTWKIEGTFHDKQKHFLEKMLNNAKKYQNTKKVIAQAGDKSLRAISTRPKMYEQLKPRVISLNSIFMEAISSIMATSKIGKSLSKYGIQITQVKFAPNYRTAGVYWIAPSLNDAQHNELILLLNTLAQPLRELIVTQHLVHNVPRFNFVEDINCLKSMELEKRLASIDIEPSDEGEIDLSKAENKFDLHFESSMERASNAQVKSSNILGLDREKLVNKVKERNLRGSGEHRLIILDADNPQNIEPDASHLDNPAYHAVHPQMMDFSEDHERVAGIVSLIKEKKREKYKYLKEEDDYLRQEDELYNKYHDLTQDEVRKIVEPNLEPDKDEEFYQEDIEDYEKISQPKTFLDPEEKSS